MRGNSALERRLPASLVTTQAPFEQGQAVDAKRQRAPLHLRVWLLLVFGAIVSGGLATERTSHGEYMEAALAGVVCAACLAGITWALLRRAQAVLQAAIRRTTSSEAQASA